MPYKETKVYYDGSHYVAIPHTKGKKRKAVRKPDEEFIITKTSDGESPRGSPVASSPPTEGRKITRKELFEEGYKEAQNLPRKQRAEYIAEKVKATFKDQDGVKEYVTSNMHRKKNNLSARRVRMLRKAHLMGFNYFCTFTYDNDLLTEQEFRKKLSKCLANLSSRNGWKYIGVWELSPKKKRLHFHGLFNIPENEMVGSFTERSDYSFSEHRRRISFENDFFRSRFGRNVFDKLNDTAGVTNAIKYLLKYIEKTGEKIVYSRGLPQFFISDIMDDDIICRMGIEDKKLLLFDNFKCWDEGEYIGEVSPNTISKLRKSN